MQLITCSADKRENNGMDAIWNSLKEQGVDSGLLGAIREFKENHPVEEKLKKRILFFLLLNR